MHAELTGNLRYLICLTIAPVFFAAAIYLCLARIVVVYGTGLWDGALSFPPRVYAILFITLDFLSMLLQACGGAITALADDYTTEHTGIHIMIVRLLLQIASLLLFIGICAVFALRVSRAARRGEVVYGVLRRSVRFRGFLVGKSLSFPPCFFCRLKQ